MSYNPGIEVLRGLSEMDELLTGTDSGDILSAGTGNDTLDGGGGDDGFRPSLGNHRVDGGEDDFIF